MPKVHIAGLMRRRKAWHRAFKQMNPEERRAARIAQRKVERAEGLLRHPDANT
jgi:hypothetical protein